MKGRIAVLATLTLISLPLTVTPGAQATNPPYLREMPATERVRTEVRGEDAMDTAARQMGAFWQLMQIVQELAGQRLYRNQLTPDEGRLLGQYRLGYSTAEQPYAHIPRSPSHPDKEKWFRMHSFYETDPGFRDELLDKFFGEEFRAAYYRATGRPRQGNRPAGNAPTAAAAKPPSTDKPTGRPASTPPRPPAGGSEDAYVAQGNKYLEARQYPKAIDAYKQAIALEPSAGAYRSLASVYFALKQYPNAVAALQQAIRLAPDDADHRFYLGVAYSQMEQYENAISTLREVTRLKPDDPAAFAIMGNAYADMEQFPEALAAFQQAIRLTPKNAIYHSNLGITYVEMGRKEEALQVLRTLQRLDPASAKELAEDIDLIEGNDPQALLDLGMALSIKPGQQTHALRLLRRVIVMNRDPKLVGEAYDWTGNIYTGQQKEAKATAAYQQAAVFYEKALRLKPNDADLLYWLCSTYITLNKKQEARQIYSRLQRVDRKKAQELANAINGLK